MKAVILAGGHGTRLQPLTHTTQKQLLPVGNKPVIEYVIDNLYDAGIDEIGIVIGGRYPSKLKHNLAETYAHPKNETGPELTFIDQGEPLGLANAVTCAKEFVEEESFVVFFGDTIIQREIVSTVVQSFSDSDASIYLPLQQVDEPSRYGIIEFENSIPANVHEKPDTPPSSLAYMGIVAFDPILFEYIEQITVSDRGELELTDAIGLLVQDRDDIKWQEFEGTWIDVGTPPDLLKANKTMLDTIHSSEGYNNNTKWNKNSGQETGDLYNDVEIVEPVAIGEGVEIEGKSRIGPYVSINDNCNINGSDLINTIVLEDATIKNTKLQNSIIGENSTIKNISDVLSCTVGTDSVIALEGRDTDSN